MTAQPPRTTPIEELREQMSKMSIAELAALRDELRGDCAAIQAQIESRGRTDIVWFRRAREALGHTVKRVHMVRAELLRRRDAQPATGKPPVAWDSAARAESSGSQHRGWALARHLLYGVHVAIEQLERGEHLDAAVTLRQLLETTSGEGENA